MATSGHSDMTTLIRTKRARNVFLPVTDALTGFYGTGNEAWHVRPASKTDNGYGRNFRGNGQADEECRESEKCAFCFFHGAKV